MKRTGMAEYWLTFHAVLLFIFTIAAAAAAADSNIIHTLPGFPGILPFKLETGYISLGENGEHQLFYYFVESERDPVEDPLVFWITGGPGCSGLGPLVYQIGPMNFSFSTFNGGLPDLVLNPYSWTKFASIIFIDGPVGTGFSYVNSSQVYIPSDTKSTWDYYMFLRKWLLNHPSFIKNRLYVGGDSNGGKMAPMVALEIAKGIEARLEPRIRLQVNDIHVFLVNNVKQNQQINDFWKVNQGYLVGNPVTDGKMHVNDRIPHAHRMSLISDEYFELAKSSCNGEYLNPDPNNYECLNALQLIKKCIGNINLLHILVPKCELSPPKDDGFTQRRMIIDNDPIDFLFQPKQIDPWCLINNHVTSYVWANDESVQEALYVRKGTIKDYWKRCNRSFLNEFDVESAVPYHRLLSEKGYQALIYSGDHDLGVPYLSTRKWIRSLNLSVDDDWRPWTVDGQVAGYTEKYKENEAYLTFATVKGAGHTAPEYKPKECFAMAYRWLSLSPL